jgi:hypothetical protein
MIQIICNSDNGLQTLDIRLFLVGALLFVVRCEVFMVRVEFSKFIELMQSLK